MTSLFACVQNAHSRLLQLAPLLQPVVLLIIRLYWGWHFMEHGWEKLMHHEKTAAYFASLDIPMAGLNAYLAGGAEFFGGFLLLVGLFSRAACVPLIFTMIIAYSTAALDATKAIFSDPDQFTSANPFLFLYAAVIVLAIGPGAISLDYILERFYGLKFRGASGCLRENSIH